jgi:leucyl/phenylalanyl-tRNA---protein transferase
VPPEPPPSDWHFPPATAADEHGLVGIGADLEPGTLIGAYRRGLFPMPLSGRRPVGWWSPDPRGVLRLDELRVTRSMRRSARRYEVRVDHAFDEVMAACADPARDGGWITAEIRTAYGRLHRSGWAHSVEAWDVETGELAGGLYGVKVDGLFAGESMFHRGRDASKVALMALVERLTTIGVVLLDVQWLTPHLESLGAVEIPRAEYLALLEQALGTPTGPFRDG